jgi:hypothetical protein
VRIRLLVTILGPVAALAALPALAACSAKPATPGVPMLSGSAAPAGQPTGQARRDALHAAAECIRQHGFPKYQDPVLTSDGHVYTDARTIESGEDATIEAAQHACAAQISQAQFQPDAQAPAPPRLVAAGVKLAQCLRAHGMPNVKDPTSNTHFTPGHGFGLTPDEVPAGGKTNPIFGRALEACAKENDDEIRVSTLAELAHG